LKEATVGIDREAGRARTRAWRRAALVVLAVTALIAPVVTPGSGAPPATAATSAASIDYPTWAQVKAARKSETTTKAQIATIKKLLAQLESDLQAARAVEIAKGEAYEKAQDAYDTQSQITDQLVTQADAAGKAADEAKKLATRLLALLGRSGGEDVVARLLAHTDDSEGLLARLETMDRLSQRSEQVYSDALQLRNTADSLSDQADVAKKKLDELKDVAETALNAARQATAAADAAVQAQEDHKADLAAQLSVLTEKREATEKDYQAGVVAREKARKARLAAEAAAAAASGGANSEGWALPSHGYISSGFGMRYHPIYHSWRLHTGTDIAGQGCGANIHAAHSGTVTYAGWNGTLGNYVQIDHGDGTSSGYGHIVSGGILVRYGQHVDAGQTIAHVGTTGASTGCHLHFIIRINGNLTNPVPFMRDHGIRLGG
jgi:murein DD-endopeptidase MepM/ murein hydrolase activator NlpD